VFKPYEGRDQVLRLLAAAERVLGVGEGFRYVHQLEDADDRIAVLEDGLISELTVMIRPASALQAVGARMAEELESA
jgi:hypothetical protein